MHLSREQHDLSSLAPLGRMLLALTLVAIALFNMFIPLIAQRWHQPALGEPPIDLTVWGWGPDGWIAASLLLLFVGRALVRGKRQAWFLSVALFALSLLDTLLEKSHWFPIVLTGGVLLLLLLLAPLFSIRSDTRSFVRGYGTLLLSGICISGYGIAFQLLHQGKPLASFFARGDVLLILRVLCFLVLWYGVVAVLRPVRLAARLPQQDRLRTEMVVRRYGRLALVYFALNADKRYFWSLSGRSLIAYRAVRGIALVLSDPIGPQEEREQCLKDFFAFCQQQDWRVVFYQASLSTRLLCQEYGLYTYKIGEEAILDIHNFTLEGKRGAPVRHAIARAKRDGVTIQCWHEQHIPASIFADMKRLSSAWMQERKIQEQFGFSMGRFPLDWSPELLTVVALGTTDEVQAFLTWTPMFAGEGWALDVMRRGKETAPGTMEFLIAEAVAWAKTRGYKQMSLGLAPLVGLVDTTQKASIPSFIERSAASLHQRGLLLGQYRSLYAFKAKFHPQWEERCLIVSERQALPQTLLALAWVHGYGVRYLLREAWGALWMLKSQSGSHRSVCASSEEKQTL